MSEKYLNRDDAPFTDQLWQIIDKTVVSAAKSQLSARRLLSTQGPFGLGLKALPMGDYKVEEKNTSASMTAPCIIPLTMIYSEFSLPVRDIAAFEQSCMPIDTGKIAKAAIDCARQEDNLIFNGSKTIGCKGLMNIDDTNSMKLKPWTDPGIAAENIIQAVTILDREGFHGPFTLGLAPDLYNMLFRRYPQGNQTELEHISQIVTDAIVKIPAISGGILLPSGSQFAGIVLGQDLVTGFVGPAGPEYDFLISESIALNITQPQAICILQK